MHIVYLSIAGFSIQVNLERGEEPAFIEDIFLTRILDYYSGFVLREAPSKIDYYINVKLQNTLKAYVTSMNKDFFINIFTHKDSNNIDTFYSVSEEQFYLVIRTACQQLLSKNSGFFMHGSASYIRKKANIFLGESGAGKSTIMKILNPQFKPLADDSFIIKKTEKSFYFYSTAAREKNAWFEKSKTGYTIKNIFFLKKSDQHNYRKITNKDQIVDKVFGHFFSDTDQIQSQTKSLLEFLESFNSFYELEFSLNDSLKLQVMLDTLNT